MARETDRRADAWRIIEQRAKALRARKRLSEAQAVDRVLAEDPVARKAWRTYEAALHEGLDPEDETTWPDPPEDIRPRIFAAYARSLIQQRRKAAAMNATKRTRVARIRAAFEAAAREAIAAGEKPALKDVRSRLPPEINSEIDDRSGYRYLQALRRKTATR
jgi:hypothetical protein